MSRKRYFIIILLASAVSGVHAEWGNTFYAGSSSLSGNNAYAGYGNSSAYASGVSQAGSTYNVKEVSSIAMQHSLPSMTHRSELRGQFQAPVIESFSSANNETHPGGQPRRVGGDSHPPDIMWQPVGDIPFCLLLFLIVCYSITRVRKTNKKGVR